MQCSSGTPAADQPPREVFGLTATIIHSKTIHDNKRIARHEPTNPVPHPILQI